VGALRGELRRLGHFGSIVGGSRPMQTLDQHLKTLLQAGKVTYEEAIAKAKDPRGLADMVGRKM
jgi:Tfp pilus assembly ATPase PilU